MKKITSILLVLFMLSFSALPSFAAKSVEFSASDNEVFAGDEFSVDIFISDYSQLKSAVLYVQYDEKSVKFINLSVGAIVTESSKAVSYKNINNAGNSYVQIEYKDSSGSLSSAGKFLSLTFVASDNAVGETDIKISASGNIITTAAGSVTPEINNGKVNIINNNPVNDLKPSALPEESSSDVPTDSLSPSSTENTAQNLTEGSEKNESKSSVAADDTNKADSDNKNSNDYLIIAVAVILVVFFAVIIVLSNNKTEKSKKRKSKNK